MKAGRSVLARALLGLVHAYQRWLSPALPPRCRFYPSCSAYAAEALQIHGALRGSALAGWRVLRCQPFSRGGVDEVPARRGTKKPPSALSQATERVCCGATSTVVIPVPSPRAVVVTPNQGVLSC